MDFALISALKALEQGTSKFVQRIAIRACEYEIIDMSCDQYRMAILDSCPHASFKSYSLASLLLEKGAHGAPAELDEAALDKASPPLPQSAFAAPRPRAAVPAACCRASCVLRFPQHQGLLPFLHAYTHI